jgi:2-polyprenyl-3-methyl-5-hydroxy-6-metoxy-1,4-benzoquinol methylase
VPGAEAARATSPTRLEDVPCNLCGADDPAVLFEKHGCRIVRCRSCGLSFVSPRPIGPDTVRVYEGESYYRNANACAFGYGDYLADRWLLEELFDARLTEIERYRPGRGRLLDVGCATGVLIERALRRGWKAEGLEVSAFAAAHCRERGLRVHEGDVASVRLPEGVYDVIVMDDAIEHVADPRETLRRLHALLAPGGLVTFNTPNEAGWLRRGMGRHWFHYKPQEHLYYFTPATLGRLVREAGFDVVHTRRSGKIVTLAYLCGRMRAFSPAAARILTATLARLPVARWHFLLPIGEFALFAERRP